MRLRTLGTRPGTLSTRGCGPNARVGPTRALTLSAGWTCPLASEGVPSRTSAPGATAWSIAAPLSGRSWCWRMMLIPRAISRRFWRVPCTHCRPTHTCSTWATPRPRSGAASSRQSWCAQSMSGPPWPTWSGQQAHGSCFRGCPLTSPLTIGWPVFAPMGPSMPTVYARRLCTRRMRGTSTQTCATPMSTTGAPAPTPTFATPIVFIGARPRASPMRPAWAGTLTSTTRTSTIGGSGRLGQDYVSVSRRAYRHLRLL
mmetsp:Transcript_16566/g.37408  ORF Transcript_16566/g.37408 Transcript_16566/m.37408 type:complete len:257 (+) Transcript_16566:198-968(+)